MKSAHLMRTTVLVLEETNTLTFAAAVDPLRAANRHAGHPVFDWQFATPTDRDVTLTSGLVVPAAALNRAPPCDLLIVVAGFDPDAKTTPALCASLRRLAATARIVAGIDGGPWVMARAGLLDGYKATTHWEDLPEFTQQFPDVITLDARFVESGPRMTSGGAAPAIEMMLHLIAMQNGAALADRVAGSFIYDVSSTPTRPQGRQQLGMRHSPVIARAHDIMQAHLEDPLAIAAIAQELGVSLRALQLQFRTRLDRTPQAHYLGLRLAEADRLVTQTALPLQDVALRTGFGSQSSFARAYRHHFETSARQRRRSMGGINRASDAGDVPRRSLS
ncbi:GlxA family transcriptional regulator [uncultured Roseobacter sp.]|uniref:GlxA family transcriptional regulator n=1 Tax=uncultured Roseobacter sp. TaxID=114847 RepID=UPI00260661AA|nr:GlxA family transcriptional regulator [uncultured Roseobacter sp.]